MNNPFLKDNKKYLSPLYILVVVIIAVFATEFLVMLAVHQLELPHGTEAVVDAILLIIFIFPTFYFLVYNPLARTIAELDQSKEELAEKSTYLDNILRSSTNMSIAATDKDFRILYYNPVAEKKFGYKAEEVIGKTVMEIHIQEKVDPARFERAINIVKEKGEYLYPIEMIKEGKTYYLESRVSGIWDNEKKLIGYVQMARDITERRLAEMESVKLHNEINETKQFLEKVMESATNAIFVIGLDGRFTLVNMGGSKMSGYEINELVGRPFTKVINKGNMRDVNRQFVNASIHGVQVTQYESQIIRKDGQKRFITFSLAPLYQDGKIISVVGTAEDITRRKQAEKERENLISDLNKINAELKDFAYVVSHDLKTPLRAMHNYSDFLKEDLEGKLEEDQETYLDGLARAVRQAEEFVDDLLQLSRVGRLDMIFKNICLGNFIREVIKSLDLPADTEIIMGEDWPEMDTEPTLLRQILLNLANNGLKFNHSTPKRLEFGWQSKEGGLIEMFVRDNGIGIEPRFFDQILRPFQRLHTSKEFEGTGIGLAIIMKAADRMEGSVRIESAPGEGSAFFVTLPMKRMAGD